MSETDTEFVERVALDVQVRGDIYGFDRPRLVTLARRGAEAADEIERLKAEVSALNHAEVKLLVQVDEQDAEIERLKAALREISDCKTFTDRKYMIDIARAALKENSDD